MAADRDGAQQPQWSGRRDKLYYTWFNVMYEVDVTPTPVPAFGPPRVLFRGPDLRVFPSFNGYTVASDGRFLVARQTERETKPSVFVVQNWFAEFADGQDGQGSR